MRDTAERCHEIKSQLAGKAVSAPDSAVIKAEIRQELRIQV
jgi:hypothetical protein